MRAKAMIAFLLIVSSFTIQAQKKPTYKTEEKAIEAAYKALDYEMRDGKLIQWANSVNIKGNYKVNITIKGKKGEVITVQVINREKGSVNNQNKLKNYIKEYRFPFKLPKDESFQFQYEFQF